MHKKLKHFEACDQDFEKISFASDASSMKHVSAFSQSNHRHGIPEREVTRLWIKSSCQDADVSAKDSAQMAHSFSAKVGSCYVSCHFSKLSLYNLQFSYNQSNGFHRFSVRKHLVKISTDQRRASRSCKQKQMCPGQRQSPQQPLHFVVLPQSMTKQRQTIANQLK